MGRWIVVWSVVSVVMAGIAMNSLPDSRRFISKPVWTQLECDEATFQKQLEVLDRVAPDFHSSTTYAGLVEALHEYGNFHLDIRAFEQAAITPEAELDAKRLSSQETIGQLLVRVLDDTDCLTLKVCESSIIITSCESRSARMNRVYPCPAMHSDYIYTAIEQVVPAEWASVGGDNTVLIVDTDNQSLIVVSAPYKVHMDVERLLRRLNKAAGVGWRSDRPSWSRICDKVCERLGRWIIGNDPGGANNGAAIGGVLPGRNSSSPNMMGGFSGGFF